MTSRAAKASCTSALARTGLEPRGLSREQAAAYSEMEKGMGDPWRETPCSDEMQRHLHKMKWGVEEFPDDDAA